MSRSAGPIIHFAASPSVGDLVCNGTAICGAGYAHRTEREQYVVGNWASVTCRTCHQRLRTEQANDVRDALARLDKCSPGCKGWAIIESSRGPEIQRCDACCAHLDHTTDQITDDDVAKLPEARRALRRALA